MRAQPDERNESPGSALDCLQVRVGWLPCQPRESRKERVDIESRCMSWRLRTALVPFLLQIDGGLELEDRREAQELCLQLWVVFRPLAGSARGTTMPRASPAKRKSTGRPVSRCTAESLVAVKESPRSSRTWCHSAAAAGWAAAATWPAVQPSQPSGSLFPRRPICYGGGEANGSAGG
jgi:hypothetical protein